ncbi:MAG: hypothetical protein HC881_20340 [Leptolyngbyaceae cyanobacterium SL_7_1]|nr:hypothetical protein [Leptolyngbyaceae cyanobacterium SL_7_1]
MSKCAGTPSVLHALATVLRAFPQQLRVICTLRSDFEPQLRGIGLEDFWTAARFIVPAMTREELREAIEEPASARVMYFEPHSLVDQLIDEVAQMPGALPLLSFTLSELYLKYLRSERSGERDNRAITQQDYEELGGVMRSLTRRADEEYQNLMAQHPAYDHTVRHVMLRMIAVEGGELARRQVRLSELEYPEPEDTRVDEVLQRFLDARLLVSGQDADGISYIEPAHDALVRGWQRLLEWKKAEHETLTLQRQLTGAAEEWKAVYQQLQATIGASRDGSAVGMSYLPIGGGGSNPPIYGTTIPACPYSSKSCTLPKPGLTNMKPILCKPVLPANGLMCGCVGLS